MTLSKDDPSKKSQICFGLGGFSGLFSVVVLVSLLGYIFEKKIIVVTPLLIIFLIVIPGIISIGLIYGGTKV